MPVQARNYLTMLTNLPDEFGPAAFGAKADPSASDFGAQLGAALTIGQASPPVTSVLNQKGGSDLATTRVRNRISSSTTIERRPLSYGEASMQFVPAVPALLVQPISGRSDVKAARTAAPEPKVESVTIPRSQARSHASLKATAQFATLAAARTAPPASDASDAKVDTQTTLETQVASVATAASQIRPHTKPEATAETAADSTMASKPQVRWYASQAVADLASTSSTDTRAQPPTFDGATDAKAAPQPTSENGVMSVSTSAPEPRPHTTSVETPVDRSEPPSQKPRPLAPSRAPAAVSITKAADAADPFDRVRKDSATPANPAGQAAGSPTAVTPQAAVTHSVTRDESRSPQSGPDLSSSFGQKQPQSPVAEGASGAPKTLSDGAIGRDAGVQAAPVSSDEAWLPKPALPEPAKDNEPAPSKVDITIGPRTIVHSALPELQMAGVPAGRASTSAPSPVHAPAPQIPAARVASLRVELSGGDSAHATIRERGGEIDLKVTTPNAESARHLSNEVSQLRRSLSDAGLKLRSAEIDYRSESQQRRQREDEATRHPRADLKEVFTLTEAN